MIIFTDFSTRRSCAASPDVTAGVADFPTPGKAQVRLVLDQRSIFLSGLSDFTSSPLAPRHSAVVSTEDICVNIPHVICMSRQQIV